MSYIRRVSVLVILVQITSCSMRPSSEPQDWLATLPKVQTHVHLDGSVRLETIWQIAKQEGIDLGVRTIQELAEKSRVTEPKNNLQEVLDVFWIHQKVLNSHENIRRITLENIEDASIDGVRLLELRFAPTFIAVGKPDLSNDAIISAVLDGACQGMQQFPIEVGLIAIGVRGMEMAANRSALEAVLTHKQSNHPCADRLVGYDLAAAETGDAESYLELIEDARAGGLRITIHSGEDTDAAHVQETIKVLGAERIGHGVKSWGDETTMRLIRDRNIHLELAVTSNWLTRAVPSIEKHPIRSLFEAGVSISINTDDPHLMAIDLLHEYRLLVEKFGFTREELIDINRDALEHSFLPEDIKAKVRKEYFPSNLR